MAQERSKAFPIPWRLRVDALAYLGPIDLKAFGTTQKEGQEAVKCIFAKPIKEHCSFCMAPARLRCSMCFTAYYCGGHHQRGHWEVHRVSCCVYQELRRPIVFPQKRRACRVAEV